MNDMLDHDVAPAARQDRELTLGTGTLLGIFLGLVVLCGACFGVGYAMGHKSQPTPLALNDAPTSDPAGSGAAGAIYKPPAGSPMEANSPAVPTPAPAVVPPRTAPVVRRPPPTSPATTPATSAASASAAPLARPAESARTPAVKPVSPSALLPSASPAPIVPAAPGGSIMVQVAAVSHQEDADLLIGALHARGYTVSARHAPTDSLIHVQVGPFSSKPAAEAMRQRLIGDGYNALLKY